MPCETCVEKYTKIYLKHGFSKEEARALAEKLVSRVETRQKKEVEILKRRYCSFPFRIMGLVKRFFSIEWERVNWKASLKWRMWVFRGTGGNPVDFLLPCGCPQTQIVCAVYFPCVVPNDCRGCDPACPAPPLHSHFVYMCDCVPYGGNCICRGRCAGTYTLCQKLSDYCGYACDDGYYWNGVECVFGVPAVAPRGDGLVWHSA